MSDLRTPHASSQNLYAEIKHPYNLIPIAQKEDMGLRSDRALKICANVPNISRLAFMPVCVRSMDNEWNMV